MAAHHMYLVTADQVAVDALARALQSEGFSVNIQEPGTDVPAEPGVDLTAVLLHNPTALAEVEACRDLRGLRGRDLLHLERRALGDPDHHGRELEVLLRRLTRDVAGPDQAGVPRMVRHAMHTREQQRVHRIQLPPMAPCERQYQFQRHYRVQKGFTRVQVLLAGQEGCQW